jgi:nucleoside-diphosphate-sugar epimerase
VGTTRWGATIVCSSSVVSLEMRGDMRVFVTGGTGAIGGYAVPALVGAGHSVSALARSDAKARGPARSRRHTCTGVAV